MFCTGRIFRYKNRRTEKMNLVVLFTPYSSSTQQQKTTQNAVAKSNRCDSNAYTMLM
jgi:type II secretory pathway component GspD/PulD (secretin)